MKSGFVSLVGRSNVGKSTILNAIIGKKISIVTPKKQTTINELGVKMDKASYSSIRDCDVAVLVVDASRPFGEGDQFLFDHLKFDCKLVIAFNKIDLTNIELVSALKEKYKEHYHPLAIVELSAIEKFGIEDLIKIIKENLDEGPQYYDLETITNMDIKFRIQEIIREKMLLLLKEEVPHSVAVICSDIVNDVTPIEVYAKIIVERDSQKGIVIGAKGKMIKRIGTLARKDIEQLIGRHINLQLMVQVVDNWRNSSRFLVDNL